MDFMILELFKGNIQNVLVFIDYFIKYVVVVLMKNQIVKMIVDVIFNYFIVYYGFL